MSPELMLDTVLDAILTIDYYILDDKKISIEEISTAIEGKFTRIVINYREDDSPYEEVLDYEGIELAELKDLKSILNQLISDKYIDFEYVDTDKKVSGYYITFKGKWHLRKGGYKAEEIRKRAEKKRIENNERNTIILTFILVISSTIEALLATLQIHDKYTVFCKSVRPLIYTSIIPICLTLFLVLYFKKEKIK